MSPNVVLQGMCTAIFNHGGSVQLRKPAPPEESAVSPSCRHWQSTEREPVMLTSARPIASMVGELSVALVADPKSHSSQSPLL